MGESFMQPTSNGPISVGGQFLETSEQHLVEENIVNLHKK